ncbi:hypothetical protein D3C77_541620 [compost metagenome]
MLRCQTIIGSKDDAAGALYKLFTDCCFSVGMPQYITSAMNPENSWASFALLLLHRHGLENFNQHVLTICTGKGKIRYTDIRSLLSRERIKFPNRLKIIRQLEHRQQLQPLS